MKVLHLTPETNGYEEVELLANRISRNNHFAAISINGEEFMTGGIILQDTPKIRQVLDSIPKEDQYRFCVEFKTEPFVKSYFDEK